MTTEPNINQSELSKFSVLADQWWDTDGDLRTLHDINPLRLNYILSQTGVADKSVLDIGCGGGILSETLYKQGAQVTAIDASKENIQAASFHAETQVMTIQYSVSTAEDFENNTDKQYDIITCMELLEHVPEPATLIRSCARLLRPGGLVFFSTLNRNLKSYLSAILAAEYLLQLLPRGTHRYSKFIRPSELHHWCREAGLTVSDISGMEYNPVIRKATLVSEPDINYLLTAVADQA